VVNNDGGGIFGLLEPGQEQHAAAYERIFGTPHGVDLAALCSATRTPHQIASTAEDLSAALQPQRGVRVVEVRTDRSQLRGPARPHPRRRLHRCHHTPLALIMHSATCHNCMISADAGGS
jgi:2-succinyl-5-enolpyruvyl-6-hydroxy-3-cyclohexene-1-carboxylate synthase